MYQILIRLFAPLILFMLIKDAIKRKGGFKFIKQRLGFGYDSNCSNNSTNNQPIWIHCASVGEVNAVLALIKRIQHEQPQQAIVVTTNTPTGAKYLGKQLDIANSNSSITSNIEHAYCPVDWPYAIKAFLKAYQPQKLWVVETEIWPNMYRLANKANIEISIINARLSKKTLKAPAWLQRTYKRTLANVSQILARSDADAKSFIKIGANPEKVEVLGNIKYAQHRDITASQTLLTQPYVLLASSHEDEELQVTQIWQQEKQLLGREELLVIVPRHPKRMNAIKTQLDKISLNMAIHSLGQTPNADTQVYLFDAIGQLNPLYEHAQLVIMGGSFIERGGHNLLEPAAHAKAILTGPHTFNFNEETHELLANNALVQCADYATLAKQMRELLNNPQLAYEQGQNAQQTVLKHQSILANYFLKLV